MPPVWSPLTLRAVVSGVRSTGRRGGGKAIEELDRILRSTFGSRGVHLVDSGTSALTMALQAALAVTHGPTALPAYCCYDLATAALGAQAPFLLYDISASTLSPDLVSLRRAFQAGARSVVVAHLYGLPADLGAVQLLASEFGAVVIEDAAQGSGCEWLGRPAGSHGSLGVLSFGRGKGVTGGSGGALLVNHERFVEAPFGAWTGREKHSASEGSLSDLARLFAQWVFGRPSLFWIPASLPFLGLGDTPFRAPQPISEISAVAAGVLTRTLPMVPDEVTRRRRNANWLRTELREEGAFTVPDGWQAGWLRFPVVLRRTASRVLTDYHRSLGVMPGYPLALPDLPGFGRLSGNSDDGFPGARLLADRLVTVPTHRFVRTTGVPAF